MRTNENDTFYKPVTIFTTLRGTNYLCFTKELLLLRKLVVANLLPRDAVWNLGVMGSRSYQWNNRRLETIINIAVFAASTPAKSCTNQRHPTRLLSNMHDWQKLFSFVKNMWKNEGLQQVKWEKDGTNISPQTSHLTMFPETHLIYVFLNHGEWPKESKG